MYPGKHRGLRAWCEYVYSPQSKATDNTSEPEAPLSFQLSIKANRGLDLRQITMHALYDNALLLQFLVQGTG